jgi:ParB family transcriptional regulator, chromosome partitioning protein
MIRVQMVPIAKIHVLNARARNRTKFREITENISSVGLKKPITVSRRGEGDDAYDLVCGQGRLEAYVARGETEIPALVIDATLEERYLKSLVENLARRTQTPVEMARAMLTLKERGHSNAEIAAKVGLSEKYVSNLLRLLASGEERIVAAVERGEIPITVAIDIASSDDAAIQRSLQEAYESGKLRGRAFHRVRRVIDERRVRGKTLRGSGTHTPNGPSTHDLVRTMRKETQKQELLVKKAHLCEQQLRFVLSALGDLFSEDSFVNLLRAEKLDALPKYLAESIKRR